MPIFLWKIPIPTLSHPSLTAFGEKGGIYTLLYI